MSVSEDVVRECLGIIQSHKGPKWNRPDYVMHISTEEGAKIEACLLAVQQQTRLVPVAGAPDWSKMISLNEAHELWLWIDEDVFPLKIKTTQPGEWKGLENRIRCHIGPLPLKLTPHEPEMPKCPECNVQMETEQFDDDTWLCYCPKGHPKLGQVYCGDSEAEAIEAAKRGE